MTIGIYKLTNKINGKQYIGQSVNIESRRTAHFRKDHKGCPYLYASMDKHGFENFEFNIIEECGVDELNEKEQYYIQELNTLTPHGYNLDSGGQEGKYLSEETKQKISLGITGDKNPMYGKTHSNETKEFLSIITQDKRASDETKEKLSTHRQLNKTHGSKKVKDNQGRVWGSVSDCVYELNISNHLKDMLRGDRPKTKIVLELGLQYAEDDEQTTQIIEKKTKDKSINKAFKPVIDCFGTIFKNIKECSDYYNIERLSRYLKDEQKMPKGYKCLGIRFLNENEIEEHKDILKNFVNKGKRKRLIDANGNIYESIKECSQILDIPWLKCYLEGSRPWPNSIKHLGLKYFEE